MIGEPGKKEDLCAQRQEQHEIPCTPAAKQGWPIFLVHGLVFIVSVNDICHEYAGKDAEG